MQNSNRRYDLDWWRVLSIFLVFLHHVGMPFNGDDFHIMNEHSSKILDDLMVYFEQFRLPLLFLISGTGTVFAFRKRTWKQFIRERASRLLLPLIFGVFVLVPPQTYFENKANYDGYFQFYKGIFDSIETNHLWFIENLFYISILSIPIILFCKSIHAAGIAKFLKTMAAKRLGMLLWVLPLIIIRLASKYYFPDDSKDISNLSSTLFYGYFFISGILLTSFKGLWDSLKRYRKFHLLCAILASLLFYGYYFLPSEIASQYASISLRWNIWYTLGSLLSWTIIIALLGYGQVGFTKKSRLLSKMNEAIYPFYMLHQTVIVVIGYYILQWNASIVEKLVLLGLLSFVLIVLLYRLFVYPFKLSLILFGMKKN